MRSLRRKTHLLRRASRGRAFQGRPKPPRTDRASCWGRRAPARVRYGIETSAPRQPIGSPFAALQNRDRQVPSQESHPRRLAKRLPARPGEGRALLAATVFAPVANGRAGRPRCGDRQVPAPGRRRRIDHRDWRLFRQTMALSENNRVETRNQPKQLDGRIDRGRVQQVFDDRLPGRHIGRTPRDRAKAGEAPRSLMSRAQAKGSRPFSVGPAPNSLPAARAATRADRGRSLRERDYRGLGQSAGGQPANVEPQRVHSGPATGAP